MIETYKLWKMCKEDAKMIPYYTKDEDDEYLQVHKEFKSFDRALEAVGTYDEVVVTKHYYQDEKDWDR